MESQPNLLIAMVLRLAGRCEASADFPPTTATSSVRAQIEI